MLVLVFLKSCVWVTEGRGGHRGSRLEVLFMMASSVPPPSHQCFLNTQKLARG